MDARPLEEVLTKGQHCLVANLLTNRPYNREAFKATIKKVWRPMKPVKFHEMGSNMIMVAFDDKMDKTRVMREGPWHFNRCLILMKDYDGKQQTSKLSITEAKFWVRIHVLPFMARNEFMGDLIGNVLGRAKEVDLDEGKIEWGEFIRVRVTLDITKPLLRRKRLAIAEKELVWITFSYERLPNFCYWCVMGHNHCDCALWRNEKEKKTESTLPYGN